MGDGGSIPTLHVTRDLAGYLVGLRLADLPAAVVDKAEDCVIDNIACSLAGAFSRRGRITLSLFGGGSGPCTVIGGERRISATEAVFCNAMTANALEWDDTFDRPGNIVFAHPGATVIPAALAVAERQGCGGEALLEAVVGAYEVCLRIGAAIQPTRRRAMTEVWGCATFQTFGAVAAAAKLLRLDVERTLWALGIAGATAPVSSTLKVWRVDRVDFHNGYGWAAAAGVRAAMLASRDFSGPTDILDGEDGFWRMYGSDQCDFDQMTEALGTRYWISDIAFKPWQACRWAHPVMDAARKIADSGLVDMTSIDSIDEIVVETFAANTRPPYNNYAPNSLLAGQFSTPYCTVVALLGESPDERHFDSGRLVEPRIDALMAKVSLVEDEAYERAFTGNGGDRLSSAVRVITGGHSVEMVVPIPWGDPRHPMSRTDLLNKLLGAVQGQLPPTRCNEILDAVGRIRGAPDLAPILSRLLVDGTGLPERSSAA